MHDGWIEELKENSKVYIAFVCIDYAGSTPLWDVLKESEIKGRFDFYRNTADRIFESFGGVSKRWSGEGNFYFFGNPSRNIDEDAVKSAIAFLTELKVGIDVEIPVRISINSGVVEFKKDFGKIDSQNISFCGHLNSASPENSILITENVYYALPQKSELREKFVLCGTTKRDRVITFIYPKEKKSKKSPDYFLPENEDNSSVYKSYIESLEGQCRTLAFSGIRQMRKMPLLELTEAFFPLKIRESESSKSYYYPEIKDDGEITSTEKRELILRKPPVDLTPQEFLPLFKEERHLVILGDPGSGKTTLLKWLCLIYSRGLKSILNSKIDEETLFPVLVPISAIYLERKKSEHISPVDAISKYYEDLGIKNISKLLEEKLEKGRCIILLDGLDEIPESKDRFSTARYIENFIRRFEKNKFIITSRILGYEEIRLPSVQEYSLCSFEDKDIEKFILNWFTAFEKELQGDTPITTKKVEQETKQLLNSINQDEGIKKLSSNPFLLTLICLIQKAGQTLPSYRIELYRLCAETLFETWNEARSISGRILSKTINYKEGEKTLAPLSLWMHENLSGGTAKEDVLKNKIIEIMKERGISKEESIKSTDDFFKYLSKETQLIVPKGGEYYGYRHLTFEEFLSARALIMQELYDEYLKKYSYNPRWTEVFLLTCGWLGIVDGREKEVTRIVEELLKRDDDLEKILNKNLLLAGKIVVENLGVKKEVAEEVVEKIYNIYFETYFWKLRDEALNILKKILLKEEGKKIYKRFISILKDRNLQDWAPGAVYALSSLIKEDKDVLNLQDWAPGAVYALSSLIKENKEVLDLLISILKDKNENEWVRGSSADAISSLVKEDKDVLNLLISILKDKNENEWVRGSSADALSSLVKEDKDILNLIISILKDKNENEWVRERSADALSSLIKEDKDILNLLISILKDKNEDRLVRGRSADALSSLIKENKEVLDLLISILKDKNENEWVRRRSAKALGNADKENKEVINLLRDEINNKTSLLIPALCSIIKLGVYNEEHINLAVDIFKKEEDGDLFNALWNVYS